MPAPLSVNGRLFHQGLDRMVALDAYNGQTLWAIEAPDLRRLNIPHDCGNWCADDDNLFVAISDRAWALDAETGVRSKTFPLTTGQRGTHDWGFIACTDDLLVGSSVPVGAQFKDFWGKAMWFDKAGDPTATAVVCSDNVFAYDKETADGRWAYGRGLIINSTITIAGDRIWFVESRPPETDRPTEGRVTGKVLWDHAHVVCLDNRTGSLVWEQPLNAVDDPTALAHIQHEKSFVQVAYGAHTNSGFLLLLSVGGATKEGFYNYLQFDGDGDLAWHQATKWTSNHHGSHMAHPVVLSDRVYVEPGGVELAGGKILDHTFGPREGCATVVASADSLFFRGINRCLTQWSFDSRTPSKWSRVRPSCWINMLPSQGLMLIPEGGGGCSCGGWMETSMGLIPNTLLLSP
ncbi:MAG: PQQ-binding-like beta-propeller repeat protein, partial [Verrucomicrobiales bacterium]|nr:PQQ-binding-like beta-propeller repeat protein [Verrucomicrobiales bacterium]